jgi:hypothetical protein
MCTVGFLAEVIVIAVHPFPYIEKLYIVPTLDMMDTKSVYLDIEYLLSDFLFAFMFLRVYFLIRTCMNYSVYNELFSRKICHQYGFDGNTSFCIKALVLKSPG